MFSYCNSLEFVNLSNFDTRKVENMVMLFFACRSLKSVDVSSFDTSIVQNMHNIFDGCINLDFLNITNFVYNSRTSISNGYLDMFQEDAKLHLFISNDFYTKILGQNPYLKVIDENVTIIGE